jgi:hypothetical protein
MNGAAEPLREMTPLERDLSNYKTGWSRIGCFGKPSTSQCAFSYREIEYSNILMKDARSAVGSQFVVLPIDLEFRHL